MEQIKTNGKEALSALKEKYKDLKTEVDNLEEIYTAVAEAYEEGLNNSELSEIELEKLKNDYETAKTNYENKVDEYDSKIDEYNDKVMELNTKINELTPTYVESDWGKTNDDQFAIDISEFSGEKPFVAWIKLVTSDATYYDEAIYTVTGEKEENVNVTGISINKETLSIEIGSTYTLSATVKPSDATDKTLKWTSDNEDVATVVDGKVTAKSVGTATITVTTNEGNYTATCKVNVIEKEEEKEKQEQEKEEEKEKEEQKEDDTVADKNIPQTGISNIVIVAIIALGVLEIVFYKKYKYLNIK